MGMLLKERTEYSNSRWVLSHYRIALVGAVALLPNTACAHGISAWIVMATISPLFAICLAIVIGILARNVWLAAIHILVILVWVIAFWLASNYVINDYIIWTPLVLYGLHLIVLMILLIVKIDSRIRRKKEPTAC